MENGLKDRLMEMADLLSQYKKVVIISDKNVAKIYLSGIRKQFKLMGSEVNTIVIPPGEESKSLGQAEDIYYKLVEFGITRSDLIVALGGGVVGDLVGFCAATFLRGVDFVQIPTSLLAQVDSSVGGKVGVDVGFGKNLVGAFYQPKMVIIDPEFLDTLDDHYLTDGMGEVIKYGCISSAKLFVRLMGFEYQE
ncbi:MAG: iron-containing alcohol dehydrogenase, partial [Eubacterium sp.]